MSEQNQYLTEDHYLVCSKAIAFKKVKVTSHKLVSFSGTLVATTADTMKNNAFACVGGSSGVFGMSLLGLAALGAGIAVCCLAIPVFGWAAAAIIAAAILLAVGAGYIKCKMNATQRIWQNYNPNLIIHGNYGLIVNESVLFCPPEGTAVKTKETFWEALFSQTITNLGHIANFAEMFLTGLGIGGFAKTFFKELGEQGLKIASKNFGKEFLRVAKEEIKDQFDPRNIVQNWKDGHRFCAFLKGAGMTGQALDIYNTLSDGELSAIDKAKKLGIDLIQSVFMAKGATEVCFPSGTQVHTKNGLTNIESLRVDDWVWTFNEQTQEKEIKPITAVYKRTTYQMCFVELSNGEVLQVTPEHRFYSSGRWVTIADMEVGDTLQTKDDIYLVIENKETITTLVNVYNFDVADNRNYYVTKDGILVHNGEYRGKPTEIPADADDEAVRALARENESAQILSNEHDVYQNPTGDFGGKKPDYLIDNEVYDCYSPSSSKPRNIASEMEGKILEGQTSRIVLNMDDTPVSIDDIKKQLDDWPIDGLDNLIFIKDGKIIK